MPDSTNGPTLTVLSRVGCHLCDDASRIVARVAADHGLTVRERDVDDEPGLAEYSDLVPVVLINDVMHQHWRIDETRLRNALAPPARRRWWRRR